MVEDVNGLWKRKLSSAHKIARYDYDYDYFLDEDGLNLLLFISGFNEIY